MFCLCTRLQGMVGSECPVIEKNIKLAIPECQYYLRWRAHLLQDLQLSWLPVIGIGWCDLLTAAVFPSCLIGWGVAVWTNFFSIPAEIDIPLNNDENYNMAFNQAGNTWWEYQCLTRYKKAEKWHTRLLPCWNNELSLLLWNRCLGSRTCRPPFININLDQY